MHRAPLVDSRHQYRRRQPREAHHLVAQGAGRRQRRAGEDDRWERLEPELPHPAERGDAARHRDVLAAAGAERHHVRAGVHELRPEQLSDTVSDVRQPRRRVPGDVRHRYGERVLRRELPGAELQRRERLHRRHLLADDGLHEHADHRLHHDHHLDDVAHEHDVDHHRHHDVHLDDHHRYDVHVDHHHRHDLDVDDRRDDVHVDDHRHDVDVDHDRHDEHDVDDQHHHHDQLVDDHHEQHDDHVDHQHDEHARDVDDEHDDHQQHHHDDHCRR